MSKDGFYQSLYNYALKRFSMLFLGHETTVIYHTFQFSQFSHSVMSDSLQPHGLQYARLPCPSPTPGACSNYGHQVGDAIQPSHPLPCPSPSTFNLFQHQGLFQWVISSHSVQCSSVQLFSRVQLFETPWTTAHQASLSITNSQSLLKLTSIESVMPSNHLIICHPLLLLPSIFTNIRVFSNESA